MAWHEVETLAKPGDLSSALPYSVCLAWSALLFGAMWLGDVASGGQRFDGRLPIMLDDLDDIPPSNCLLSFHL